MRNRSISQWSRTRRLAYFVVLPLLCLGVPTGVHAQTLTTLHSFNGTDGAYPSTQLTKSHVVQHSNGNFYGTTPLGGANSDGTVFQITAGGAETTLYNFCSGGTACPDGSSPEGALALGKDGNFYGTTFVGGANNDGTVFKITPGGSLTTLHSFSGADGVNPGGDLVQSNSNGNFYGTAYAGGNSNSAGTLFEITPAGALTTLYTFCSKTNCNDGSAPNVPLSQDSWGDFYGTTNANGANAGGTLFVLTWWGGFHTIYHFCAKTNCTDGAQPLGGPVLGNDFNIYGTTVAGGTNNAGTVYQFTPWHQLTSLYSFCSKANCADGQNPEAALTQGKDGNF